MLLPFFLLLFPLSSTGSEWTYVTDNADGARFYLDLSNMDFVSDSAVRVWVKSVPEKPLSESREHVSYLVAYIEIDCSRTWYRFLNITSFYSNGTHDTDDYTGSERHRIAPNSPFEVISLSACLPLRNNR